MAENRPGSVLAVDFGNIYTRAILMNAIDGNYRVIAQAESRTTLDSPINDLLVGLRRVTNQLTEVTGRELMTRSGVIITPEQSNRSGVDYFVTTTSTGRAMRAILVGLLEDVSLTSSLHAISETYIEAVDTIHLNDGRDEEGRLNSILLNRPDLIFISGGTEGGAEKPVLDLAKIAHWAVQLTDPSLRPVVIYAGNSKLAEPIREMFEGSTSVYVADNIRPSIEREAIGMVQNQLGQAFDTFEEHHGGGFEQIGHVSSTGIFPSSQSYTLITEYLAQATGQNILTIDIGSVSTTLVSAFDGNVNTKIHTDIGLGHSAHGLFQQASADRIRRWLPFNIATHELESYALNKTLHPASVPMSLRELYIEHAFLRAGVEFIVGEARFTWDNVSNYGELPSVDLVLGAGSAFTKTGHPGYNLLLLMDALQPAGITQFKVDTNGLIPALGALAHVNPEMVVQVLEGDDLETLGTVVTVSGEPKKDKISLKLKIKTEDGEVFEHEVEGGHIWMLPLPEAASLELDMRVARGLNINGKRRVKMTLTGGTAGLIFDVRGRPLQNGRTVQERAEQMPLWVHEITEDPLQEISPDWLEEIDEEEIVVRKRPSKKAQQTQSKRRRGLFGRGRKREEEQGEIPDHVMDDLFPEELVAEDESKNDNESDEVDLRDLLS